MSNVVGSLNPSRVGFLGRLTFGLTTLGALATGGVILNNQYEQNQQVNVKLEELKTRNERLEIEISKRVGRVGLEQVPSIVAKAAASTLMTFDTTEDGKKIEKDGWTSSIVRIDGQLYVISCAHASPSISHFVSQEITFEAFDGSYSFKVTPRPFKDGSIGFFPLEDISIFLLTEPEISKLPNNGKDIGFELEDMTAVKHGTPVFTLANSTPYPNSLHMGFVVHPAQIVKDKTEVFPNQIIHFPMDPGNSGAPLINLLTGNLCGIAVAGEEGAKGSPSRGYSGNARLIKTTLLSGLALNVMSKEEKKLFGNNPPPANKAMNIQTLRALENFPFPRAVTPLEHLMSVVNYLENHRVTAETPK